MLMFLGKAVSDWLLVPREPCMTVCMRVCVAEADHAEGC